MRSYVTGNVAPPAQIVKNKKDFLKDLLEANKGQWVTNSQIKMEAERHGLGMNQMTARVSDLREDYFPKGLGIFSEKTDEHQGAWKYKLDDLTQEYIDAFKDRRKAPLKLSAEDKLNIETSLTILISKIPIQNDSFWATAKKFGVKNPLTP